MIIKILLFPVMLLLMLYFVIGLIVPTYRTITAEKLIIIQKEASLAEANEKLNTINTFIQAVETHPQEKKFVMDFVPDDRREEIILNDLSQVATKSGVSLFSVGFADGGKSSDANQQVQSIEGKIVASGTYENFKKFSNELFHMKRLYAFKTFELTKAEKPEGEDAPQEQMLSGTLSFAYGYVPGQVQVNPSLLDQAADFELVGNVMNATIDTNPLVSQPTNRSNPFLP